METPSPSNDEWFDNPQNVESVNKGISEMKEGKTKAYSMNEIRDALGI